MHQNHLEGGQGACPAGADRRRARSYFAAFFGLTFLSTLLLVQVRSFTLPPLPFSFCAVILALPLLDLCLVRACAASLPWGKHCKVRSCECDRSVVGAAHSAIRTQTQLCPFTAIGCADIVCEPQLFHGPIREECLCALFLCGDTRNVGHVHRPHDRSAGGLTELDEPVQLPCLVCNMHCGWRVLASMHHTSVLPARSLTMSWKAH